MVQQYLGPNRGVIGLSTWDELVDAAEGGLLEENQWCELKEMPTRQNQPKKDANLEMARDLASLSLDGGLLIYGVRDKTFEVVGCDITGLEDRISNVAATRVHPPLSPNILSIIRHPEEETLQVLVVQVPPSPLAPHMADNTYWGRSTNGKRPLSDAEVRRHLTQRDQGEGAFRMRLMEMESRDPLADWIEDEQTGNGHVYILAQPCAPVVGNGEEQGSSILTQGMRRSNWHGTVRDCTYQAFDPNGEAYATVGAYGNPVSAQLERSLCHISVKDDSCVEVVSGGGTATYEAQPGRPANFLLGGLVSALVIQTLELLKGRSQAWGYTGLWRVGLRITKTRGRSTRTLGPSRAFPPLEPTSTSAQPLSKRRQVMRWWMRNHF